MNIDSKITVKSSKDSQKSKLSNSKSTHLYLNDRYLKTIPKLLGFTNLVVLYLHNNEIYQIEHLENVPKLISLYLQKNNISKIENVNNLTWLRKLYLGHNRITVIENLTNMPKLEELYLEKQETNTGMCFDPRSIISLAETLRILDLSNNKITSITELRPLKLLTIFHAGNNELEHLSEVCSTISNWMYIKEIIFHGNPISKQRTYKENIIASCYNLKLLDQKEITQQQRNFLKNFHKQRLANTWKKPINLAEEFSGLPKNYPIALQKAVSLSILREEKNVYDDLTNISDTEPFIAWKAFPKRVTVPKVSLYFRSLEEIRNKNFRK